MMKKSHSARFALIGAVFAASIPGLNAAENWEAISEDNASTASYDKGNLSHEGDLTFVVVKTDYKDARTKLGDDGKDISFKVGLARVALDCGSSEVWEFSKGFQDLNSGKDVWDENQFLIDRWPRYARPVYGKVYPELLKKVCK